MHGGFVCCLFKAAFLEKRRWVLILHIAQILHPFSCSYLFDFARKAVFSEVRSWLNSAACTCWKSFSLTVSSECHLSCQITFHLYMKLGQTLKDLLPRGSTMLEHEQNCGSDYANAGINEAGCLLRQSRRSDDVLCSQCFPFQCSTYPYYY